MKLTRIVYKHHVVLYQSHADKSGYHSRTFVYFYSLGDNVRVFKLNMLEAERKIISFNCRFLEEFQKKSEEEDHELTLVCWIKQRLPNDFVVTEVYQSAKRNHASGFIW
jgi:hypothetical protein